MEIVDLRYLVACADAGKFTLAAIALNIETSTISRRMSNLEDELGLALFERKHSGIRLTRGGSAVLDRAQRILSDLDAMQRTGRQHARGEVGEVRLGLRIPPIGGRAQEMIRNWREANPDVGLTIVEGHQRNLALALTERRLDAVLLTGHAMWPNVTAVRLFRERLVGVLPTNHHLAGRQSLDWASLSVETILVQGWDDNQTQREFYGTLLGNGARFRIHSASKQTILALVGAGYGVTLITDSMAEAPVPGVIFKPINEPNAWLEFDLIWLPETEDPVIGRFVAFMRDGWHGRELVPNRS
jgi:DNA-binding transcriptional LysR family regulator